MQCLDIYRNATQLLKQSGKEFVQGLNKKKTWLKREENEEDFDYLFEEQRLKINKLRVQKLIEQIWQLKEILIKRRDHQEFSSTVC